MSRKRVHLVMGTRPNFMKVAPLFHYLKNNDLGIAAQLVYTGQHYDAMMSDTFLQDFSLPKPDYYLNCLGVTHAEQTADIMIKYEQVCAKVKPDLTIVVGDVNSTLACAIVAKKMHIPVAHLEAGLRSFDRTMPEEINRMATDAISDILWTPSRDANENLKKEGVALKNIDFVGNIMIDAFESLRSKIESLALHKTLELGGKSYSVVTLHRPANVDHKETLAAIIETLCNLSEISPLIFSVHPRTEKQLKVFGLRKKLDDFPRIKLMGPLSYIPFMSLVLNSSLVITDSGGIQEETSYLGIPCLTLRENTERPITIHQGSNQLTSLHNFHQDAIKAYQGTRKEVKIEYWDGRTAERTAISLRRFLDHELS